MTTSTPQAGAIGWFEIGTSRPEETQAFYAALFGWTFTPGPIAGFDYRDITTGPAHPLQGGVLVTPPQVPGYAIFVVTVADVAATCQQVSEHGGTVDLGPTSTDDGLSFAYVSDPHGNRFGVFSPPQR